MMSQRRRFSILQLISVLFLLFLLSDLYSGPDIIIRCHAQATDDTDLSSSTPSSSATAPLFTNKPLPDPNAGGGDNEDDDHHGTKKTVLRTVLRYAAVAAFVSVVVPLTCGSLGFALNVIHSQCFRCQRIHSDCGHTCNRVHRRLLCIEIHDECPLCDEPVTIVCEHCANIARGLDDSSSSSASASGNDDDDTTGFTDDDDEQHQDPRTAEPLTGDPNDLTAPPFLFPEGEEHQHQQQALFFPPSFVPGTTPTEERVPEEEEDGAKEERLERTEVGVAAPQPLHNEPATPRDPERLAQAQRDTRRLRHREKRKRQRLQAETGYDIGVFTMTDRGLATLPHVVTHPCYKWRAWNAMPDGAREATLVMDDAAAPRRVTCPVCQHPLQVPEFCAQDESGEDNDYYFEDRGGGGRGPSTHPALQVNPPAALGEEEEMDDR